MQESSLHHELIKGHGDDEQKSTKDQTVGVYELLEDLKNILNIELKSASNQLIDAHLIKREYDLSGNND